MPFRDDGVDIEITADDRKARPAIERTNSSIARIEKSAQAMGNALRGAWGFIDRITQSTISGARAMLDYKEAIAKTGVAVAFGAGAANQMVTGYRALRLAISPTMFTAFTIGVGVAAEAVIKLSLAQARLIDQQALTAKRAGMSFGDVRSLSFAADAAGVSKDFWTSTGKSADELVTIAAAYEKLSDPVERAALAISEFGADAEKIMPMLDQRLINNIDTARKWGVELTVASRTAVSNLRRDLGELGAIFALFGNQFSAAWEVVKVKTVSGAAALNEARRWWYGGADSVQQGREFEKGEFRKRFPLPPELREIEATMGLGYPKQPGVPAGNIFGGMAARASYLASKEGLQERRGALQSRREAIIKDFEFSPAVASSALNGIDAEMRVVDARIKVLEKQEENLRKEEALIEKLGKFEYENKADIPDWITGRRRMEPSLLVGPRGRPRLGANIPEFELPGSNLPEIERLAGPSKLMRELIPAFETPETKWPRIGGRTIPEQQAEDLRIMEAKDRAAEHTLQYQIKALELSAGPGGELATVEKIYQLRLAYAQTQVKTESIQAAIVEAGFERENRILEIQKRRFDELRSSFEGLFDAAFSGARGFWDAVKRMALSVFLTPVKRALSGWVANALTGGGGGGGGFGGPGGFAGALGGMLGGGFGGGVTAGAPELATGAGMAGLALGPGAMGAGGGGSLGSLASGAGSLGLMAKLGAMGPMFALGGAGLIAGGISRRNTTAGLAMGAGGGALAAIGIGMMFGGPIGALVGAGIGLGTVLFSRLWETAEQKVIDKVQQLYDIKIDKTFARQIVDMAKQTYGGNLDMAVRAPATRELIELYSMATGQPMKGLAVKQFPTTFSQSGGRMTQQPNWWNGSPYPSTTGPPNDQGAGPYVGFGKTLSVNLDPGATREFLSGRMATAIVQNPRAVGAAQLESGRQSSGRRELAAQMLTPGLVLA